MVGFDVTSQSLDQGILTEGGGNIQMFAHDSVTLGTSRIFTLRGGNEIIWSSTGDIAAGTSSKTVASAPPTRVSIDPQSADLKNDLAGLATGARPCGCVGGVARCAFQLTRVFVKLPRWKFFYDSGGWRAVLL